MATPVKLDLNDPGLARVSHLTGQIVRPIGWTRNILVFDVAEDGTEIPGPPVPLYPDGTFETKQMAAITGTCCGSFLPVDPKEYAGQLRPVQAPPVAPRVLTKTEAKLNRTEDLAFGHWQENGKGVGRGWASTRDHWDSLTTKAREPHMKAARAIIKAESAELKNAKK